MVGGLIPYVYIWFRYWTCKRSARSIRKIEGDIDIVDDL